MFVADHLIFLEMQKTGGSHIRRLLTQNIEGEIVGKHNRLDVADVSKLIVGSIRNPWDWYVSLWAYGVGGNGAIRTRTAKRIDLDYYYRMLPKAMGKNWLTPRELLTSLGHDVVKPVGKWQWTYDDADDPVRFRDWLKLLLDNDRKFDIGEGYGFSPLSRYAGLMTYRYFRLYTTGDEIFCNGCLSDPGYIQVFDQEYNVAGSMIRNESLESDFIDALTTAGYDLTEEVKSSLLKKEEGKTNVSERKPTDFYYDRETSGLVADRERYLIEKYDYTAPV